MTLAALPTDVFNTLKMIGDEDNSIMNTLISLYRKQAPEMIATIKLSASEKDQLELKEAAHTYKGVCMNLGFTPLGDICGDIEAAATQNDYLRINALCTQLEEVHGDIVSYIITLHYG